jgi:hypothetical protein
MGDYNFKPVTKVGASIPSNKVGASIANGNPVQPRKDCPNLKFGFAFPQKQIWFAWTRSTSVHSIIVKS